MPDDLRLRLQHEAWSKHRQPDRIARLQRGDEAEAGGRKPGELSGRRALIARRLRHRVEVPVARSVMRPIRRARPGVEIEAAGPAQRIVGRCLVRDATGHVDIGIGVGKVDAGGIAMARQPFATPQIDTALKAQQLAGGTRIGERPVTVVDLLADDPAPGRGDSSRRSGNRSALSPAPCARSRLPYRRRWARRPQICDQRGIAGALMQGAERRHPQLPGDRLNHAVGRDLRPDDRKHARRQRLRRRIDRQGRWQDRGFGRYWSDDEGRAQEPIVGTAAAEASTEEKIVEGAAARLAGEREGTGRRRAAVDRLHHRDAIRHRLGAGAAGIGDAQEGTAGRAATVGDDELVRRRTVGAEKRVHRDRSASPDVAGRRQERARGGAGAHVHQALDYTWIRGMDSYANCRRAINNTRYYGYPPYKPQKQLDLDVFIWCVMGFRSGWVQGRGCDISGCL